jgi:hypothetical protein
MYINEGLTFSKFTKVEQEILRKAIESEEEKEKIESQEKEKQKKLKWNVRINWMRSLLFGN